MADDFFAQFLVAAIAFGVLISATVTFHYLDTKIRNRLYIALTMLLTAVTIYVGLDVARLGSVFMWANSGVAYQMHRIQELVILTLGALVPLLVIRLAGLTGTGRSLLRWVALVGAVICCAAVVIAFVWPSLFVAPGPDSAGGVGGPAYAAGRGWLGLEIIGGFTVLTVSLVRHRDRANLTAATIGFGLAVYFGLSSFASDLFGFYIDPIPSASVSRATLSLVAPGGAAITMYVGHFVRQTRALARSNAELLESQMRLERSTLRDGLTKLPNRTAFQEAIAAMLNRSGGSNGGTLAIINIDEFSSIVDS
jgi:hypothetical protein